MKKLFTKDRLMAKKILFVLLIILLIQKSSMALENKLVVKVENEIITTIDIENEYKYLLALNPNFKNIEKKRIMEFSKNSIIREKIKKIELLKNLKEINIPDEYLDTILKSIYSKLNINNMVDFKKYLKENSIDFKFVKNKIEIETIWNELIYKKFSSKISINREDLKKEILKNNFSKSYFFSEILFEISKLKDLNKKFTEIEKTINMEGFESAALTHSISDTSSSGGKLGWVKENTMNKNIKDKISNLKINEFTKPITVPGGFLILKLDEVKKTKNDQNVELELKKLMKIKRNEQLNQFSTMYFNKVKKNIQINEI